MPDAVFSLRICRACGRRSVPPVAICPVCLGDDLAELPVPTEAKLVSWTFVRRPAAGFDANGAFAVGVARLVDGNLITGRLSSIDGASVGAAVNVALDDRGGIAIAVVAGS